MVVETRVLIVARLAEIGAKLNGLKSLSLSKQVQLTKALREERKRLNQELASLLPKEDLS